MCSFARLPRSGPVLSPRCAPAPLRSRALTSLRACPAQVPCSHLFARLPRSGPCSHHVARLPRSGLCMHACPSSGPVLSPLCAPAPLRPLLSPCCAPAPLRPLHARLPQLRSRAFISLRTPAPLRSRARALVVRLPVIAVRRVRPPLGSLIASQCSGCSHTPHVDGHIECSCIQGVRPQQLVCTPVSAHTTSYSAPVSPFSGHGSSCPRRAV